MLPSGLWPIDGLCLGEDASGNNGSLNIPATVNFVPDQVDSAYFKPKSTAGLSISNTAMRFSTTGSWTWMGYVKVTGTDLCCYLDLRYSIAPVVFGAGRLHACNNGKQYVNLQTNVYHAFATMPIIVNQKYFWSFSFNSITKKLTSMQNDVTAEWQTTVSTTTQDTNVIKLSEDCAVDIFYYGLAFYNEFLTFDAIKEERKRLLLQTSKCLVYRVTKEKLWSILRKL